MYKIKFLEMIQSLWKLYRRSGVDDLDIDSEIQGINRQIWPKEIQLLVEQLRAILFDAQSTSNLSQLPFPWVHNFYTYISFTDSCLHAIQKKTRSITTKIK